MRRVLCASAAIQTTETEVTTVYTGARAEVAAGQGVARTSHREWLGKVHEGFVVHDEKMMELLGTGMI
jgi:hypothetical protein